MWRSCLAFPGKFTQMLLEMMEPCFARCVWTCSISKLKSSLRIESVLQLSDLKYGLQSMKLLAMRSFCATSWDQSMKGYHVSLLWQISSFQNFVWTESLESFLEVQDAYQILEELRDPTIYDASSEDSWLCSWSLLTSPPASFFNFGLKQCCYTFSKTMREKERVRLNARFEGLSGEFVGTKERSSRSKSIVSNKIHVGLQIK